MAEMYQPYRKWAFTFTFVEQGSLVVKNVYDDNGRLTGVKIVEDRSITVE